MGVVGDGISVNSEVEVVVWNFNYTVVIVCDIQGPCLYYFQHNLLVRDYICPIVQYS